jgi:hypothetical protein
MGRAHAITREKRDQMLAALRAGALYRDAAESAGIPWRTWMDWSRSVREGACTNDDVRELVERARSAYAGANVGLAATVSKAAQKDWRAAAWQLDHRRGDPKARHDAKRARWEARLTKAEVAKAESQSQQPVVVIELPASLVKPREAT